MDVAVSTTDLYLAVNYEDGGSVASTALMRIPLSGGHPSQAATFDGTEQGLLVVNQFVVIALSRRDSSGASTGEIIRLDLDGRNRTTLASGRIPSSSLFGPAGILATDDHNVYFAAEDGAKSVPLLGGAARSLTTNTGSLAVVGSNLVIADRSAGAIVSVPLQGGRVTTLVDHLSGALGPVVTCGDAICWASEDEVAPVQTGTGAITKLASSNGSTPSTLASDGGLYIVQRLAFDGTTFFATMGADASPGSLARIPAQGGSPVFMGAGFGLAIDDQCVYSAGALSGVYSVVKTYQGALQ